jgi:ABC-type sugar transport system, periplasmic component
MGRKILAGLLAISMLAAVSGCSSPSSASPSSSASSASSSNPSSAGDTKLSGSLSIWAMEGSDVEAQARKDEIELFIKEHPELKVTYTVIPTSNSTWDQKQAAALAAGNAGDVMEMSPDYYGMNTKYYIDLNPYVKKDGIDLKSKLMPGMIDGYYDSDGKLEGMPCFANCFVMAYNKDMFDKAGVPYPKDGWTMDSLLDWGKKFVAGSGASQTYALAKHWVMDNVMIYAEGGTPYTSDLKTSNMGTDEIAKSLALYKKLISSGIMPSDTAQKSIPAETLFVSGKTAMYPMGGFEAEQVINDAEENGIQLGFASMPSDPSGKEINIQYAGGWAITDTCKNKDAAWQFVKEVSYENDDMGAINAKCGIPASFKVAQDKYAKMTTGDIKFDNTYYLDHISKTHVNPFGGTLASSGNIWTNMVQEVTLNNQDPAQVVKTDAPKIAEEFAKYPFNKK